jgi:hypothetical protein
VESGQLFRNAYRTVSIFQKAELMAQEGIIDVLCCVNCFRRPIWKECLQVGGTAYERIRLSGGGSSEEERNHVIAKLISRTV